MEHKNLCIATFQNEKHACAVAKTLNQTFAPCLTKARIIPAYGRFDLVIEPIPPTQNDIDHWVIAQVAASKMYHYMTKF